MSWIKKVVNHHKMLQNHGHNYSGRALVAKKYPDSVIAEQFRTLRTNLSFTHNQCIAITSDSPSEGKSTVSANLAIIWAQDGKKVCLVDCDMRRATVAKTFSLSNHYGLSSILSNHMRPFVRSTKIPNLYVVTSGPIPPNPSELVSNPRMDHLLAILKRHFDVIILDDSPINVISDASIIASKADGVIIVIPQDMAGKNDVKTEIKQLRKVHAKILGAVMNVVTHRKSQKSYYYYY